MICWGLQGYFMRNQKVARYFESQNRGPRRFHQFSSIHQFRLGGTRAEPQTTEDRWI